jgi:predicted metal-binding protein
VKTHARANWDRVLLVCAKCSKKLDGGFGPKGRTPLAKALRRELGAGKGRKAPLGVVEVKCLGICPRGAVTLVDSSEPGRWHLVQPGDDLSAL